MAQVTEGSLFRFTQGNLKILLANLNGEIFATDLICTHAEADLSKGKIVDKGVKCPLHRSVFDLESGRPLGPPADMPIKTYNVKVENNEIFVEI
jgi:nitrite reductase/ring-hydroxylating ferredoxin subunit